MKTEPKENKKGRLIVRNINYDLKEKHLKLLFEKYGEVKEVAVPIKLENNLNKGFAFVQFVKKEDAEKAIKALNG